MQLQNFIVLSHDLWESRACVIIASIDFPLALVISPNEFFCVGGDGWKIGGDEESGGLVV